jgi:acetyl-CoA carboxylase carboxyl transferase subunit alpha
LLKQKIIDRIVPEPLGGAHKNSVKIANDLKGILKEELNNLQKIKPEKLIQNRLEKFGKMGVFEE